jgi:glycosyltransferase involved in cell wall biosynthesis
MKPNRPYEPEAYPEGVNLFGYLKAQMGLGQGARLMANAIVQSGLPHTLLNVSVGNPAHQGESEFDGRFAKFPHYNTNIVHINPEQIPILRHLYPRCAWDRRYNIAIWLWELEEFPFEWAKHFRYFNEIWTPSTFTSASIAKSTSLSVTTIPYGIHAEADPRMNRSYFKLPEDRFLFLSMYDVNSTMERKNPLGAIDAFCAAFPRDSQDASLVVKVNNATPDSLSKLKSHIGSRQNVFVISDPMSRIEVHSLINSCDVFVSLHRSEGFGLVMAEAMFLGLPAIATGWSANTDFMKPDNSCLVDYSFTDVKDGYYQCHQGQRWADASIEHAAEYMKRLYSDKTYYYSIARAGQAYIRTELSIEESARKIASRLREIGTVTLRTEK